MSDSQNPELIDLQHNLNLTPDNLNTGNWWVVLDATDSPSVPLLMEYSDVTIRCLYKGDAAETMADIAPYLVKFDAFMFYWIKDNIWNEPWGIVFQSDAEMEDLHRHLRKFLMVQDEQGKAMWFRYYDPRVLPTFLKTCAFNELEKFFGPIQKFWCKQDSQDQFTSIARI